MDKIDRLELHSSITKVTNNNTSVMNLTTVNPYLRILKYCNQATSVRRKQVAEQYRS